MGFCSFLGTVLAIASNDGTIQMYEVATGQVRPHLSHDCVLACCLELLLIQI